MAITIAAAVTSLASSELLSKVLGPLAGKLGSDLKGAAREKWKKYTHSFERYLKEVESRHKFFSSQIFSNEGQLLENYYVPLTLQKVGASTRKSLVVVDSYPKDLISAYKDVLIVDTAGMGKSTLLKFIFLKSLTQGDAIPIFIELRKLSKDKTILGFISDELKFGSDETSTKLLESCLTEGVFTFFLDGFDEIADDDKAIVSDQIVDLKTRANGNRFILSSREEQSLAYLSEFHKFSIKPLSQDEAFILIRKIAPDPKIAASLIEKVQSQPEHSLSEFLTNPLLVSLLVKSFLHSPILPVRLSEFYRQVFDALFQNHDAKKELGGFTRKKKCNLDLDRFHKTLRALGVLTYQDNKLEFSTDDLAAQIERAKALTSETAYSASSFQHDLLHAVPLFVQEGAVIRWAHRSLQEYFAAAYICVDAKEKQAIFLLQLYNSGVEKNANLLRLCADIDGKTFKHVLVKKYLSDRLSAANGGFNPSRYPNVDAELLQIRRSLIHERNALLLVMPRAISQESAGKHVLDFFPARAAGEGLAFLNSKGMIVSHNEKVKFFLRISLSSFSVMDLIISTYFHEKIIIERPLFSIRRSYKNFPFDIAVELDANPDNPANSADNFELTAYILANLAKYLRHSYHLQKMEALLGAIVQNEKVSSSLNISFG